MSIRQAILRRKKESVRQEKRIAEDIAGRRVSGSGALTGMKGDVTEQTFLIEAKQTKAPRFSITLPLWRKIFGEAARASKLPAMVIEMAGRKVVVIDYDDFLAIKDRLS